MSTDPQQIAYAVQRLHEDRLAQDKKLLELRAELAALLDLLIARGTLAAGHRRTLARAAQVAATSATSPVRLRVYVDKRAIVGPEIDCGARLHLCKARCCRLQITLTADDVEEGKLRWKLDEPYLLRKRPDGQCVHMDEGRGCSVYEARPATCREYDCRNDKRIWADFEQRIPAAPEDEVDLAVPRPR